MIENPNVNDSQPELAHSSSGISKEPNENSESPVSVPRQTQLNYHSKKHPLISATLSFIFPGAGQLYNEQFIKALILFAASIASILSIIFTGISLGNMMIGNETADTIPPAIPVIRIVASCLIYFGLWLYGIIDGIISAQQISAQSIAIATSGDIAAKSPKKEGIISLGVILVVVGILSLMHQLGLNFKLLVRYGWPAALILLGVYVLAGTTHSQKGNK